MSLWIENVKEGLEIFAHILPLCIVVFTIKAYVSRNVNVVRFVLDLLFILYMVCVVLLVFFPLPTYEEALELNEYRFRLIPFMTTVEAFGERTAFAFLQLIFNVVMTMPLGMYLVYRVGLSGREAVIFTAGVSLLIEVGQLTGLFFTFNGSYRLCDIDDLMLNTFGGFCGVKVMDMVRNFVPELASFDLKKKVVTEVSVQ